jgi:3-oxoacyl-[acyl-carrier protein] reductase
MKLADKTAIVTGSRRGIGKAIALALSREGANVTICDINEKTPYCRQRNQASGAGHSRKCDVSVKAEVQGDDRQTVDASAS